MRIAYLVSIPLGLALIACGDDGGGTPAIDAPLAIDSSTAAVTMVPCAGATAAVTVTAPGFAFEPMTAPISTGDIVKFTMPGNHSAVSDTAGLFTAGFNADTCFRFDVAGSYPYHCDPHQFPGTIVVQ